MTDLVQRIEQASAEQQRGMLEEAWLAIHHDGHEPEGVWDDCGLCTGFVAMLDAQAWLSAAEMLVGANHGWSLAEADNETDFLSEIWSHGDDDLNVYSRGKTPALALAAAVLKAHISENPDAG